MKLFSQRNKYTPTKVEIQKEGVDEKLRTRIWNDIYLVYFEKHLYCDLSNSGIGVDFKLFYDSIWIDFFVEKINKLPRNTNEFFKYIEQFLFNCQWYEVFDFIEFLLINSNSRLIYFNEQATLLLNFSLEKEFSGYRILSGKIVEITSDVEIREIETAINSVEHSNSTKQHLTRALELLSDRNNPDYRNSIKESISAVEALCMEITGNSKVTLGQAIKQIEKTTDLHKSLQSAFSSLYGFTSEAEGIRHAMLDESSLKQEDAIFMLVSCSAFVNYLKQKVK